MAEPKLKIYYKEFDSEGNEISSGVDDKEYINYGSAINRARKLYGDRKRFKFEVAWRDPWIEYTVPSTCACCGKNYERPVTHMGYDRSSYVSLIDRSKPREYFHGYICQDCYEKIKNFINSLSKGISDDQN